VILSLNEIESTILKAARGAGMEWGLAEEASQAARWLARRGIPFEAAFLDLLEAAPWRAEIVLDPGLLRPRDSEAWLCPIRAGACLSDLGLPLPLRIERVLQPLLLLPFAARLETPVTLAFDDVSLSVCGAEVIATPADAARRAERVELTAAGKSPSIETAARSLTAGIVIDAVVWAKLQLFEARTYVPASLRSRLSGAGSAASDND
jgi:hypothetical protein